MTDAVDMSPGVLMYSMFRAVWELLESLFKIIYLTVVAVSKLMILTGPHLISLIQRVVQFHRTQMSRTDVLVEAVFVLIIVLFLVFRKRIATAIRKFEKSVATSSRVVLRIAPHLSLFVLALVFAVSGRKFLAPLSTPRMLPCFTVLLPVMTTLHRMVAVIVPTTRAMLPGSGDGQSTQELREAATSGRQLVLLWIVLSAYHSIATSLSIVPFSQRILQYLPVVREFTLVLSIWAQLSPVLVEIIFEVASPFIHYLAEKIPSSSVFRTSEDSVSNFFMTSIASLNILSPQRQGIIRAIMQESTSFVIIACCLPLPTPLATLGVTMVALLIPAVRSAAAIQAWERDGGGSSGHFSGRPEVSLSVGVFSSGRKVKKSAVLAAEIMDQQQRWLEYWLCLGSLWALRAYGMGLWPSFMMLTAWYLQHGFMKGSSVWCARIFPAAEALYIKLFKLDSSPKPEAGTETKTVTAPSCIETSAELSPNGPKELQSLPNPDPVPVPVPGLGSNPAPCEKQESTLRSRRTPSSSNKR